MAKLHTIARSALLRVLLAAVAVIACAGAIAIASGTSAFADPAPSDYEGGTIPILRVNFADDVDPGTGEVTLSGDEKLRLVIESSNHSYKATGVTIDLEVPAAYDNPEDGLWDGASGYIGESNLELEFIRGRGNSSWRVEKKPFKLKLDKKANLFGMGSNKHWVLLANYYDASLSLDRIVGWLGDEMGMPYTPRGVPVDLYMNGQYYGNYLLMEEVRIDGNRVDIDEVNENAADPDSIDITGGYLLGLDRKPDAVPGEYFQTTRGTTISYDTPEYEPPLTGAEEAQQAYLKSFFDHFEDAIFADDLESGGDGVWNLTDMDSLADYWLIQEFLCNPDAFATPSTYVYKLRDEEGTDGTVTPGKFYWGPLWDFDFVWGSIQVTGFENTEARWVTLLRQDPAFVELLEERWHVLDGKLEELTKEGGMLDRYLAEMSTSWEADIKRWPHENSHDWNSGSYAETIEELRTHIEARRAWINDNLDLLPTKYATLSFVADGDEVFSTKVRAGEGNWFELPEAPEKDGLFFNGWFTEDHEEFDRDKTYEQNTVFYAEYLDESTVSKATEIFFAQDEIWVEGGANIIFDVGPKDARDQRVVWSSADESIVKVYDSFVIAEDGCLGENETVETTVTARLPGSGVEKTIRVVVFDRNRTTLPEPESFSFPDSIELESGEYKQLDWTVSPSPNALNENFNLFFLVDDEDIATCSEAGVVTGKSPGTTKIKMIRENPQTEQEEVVAEVTVIVKEDDAETFSIVFKLNGGSIDGSTDDIVEEHEAGEVITMPDAPERDGYLFAYWKGSRYLPGDEYTVTGDHTFTAQWEKEGAEDGDDSGSGAKTISGNASPTSVKSSGSNGSNGSSTGSGTMTKTADKHRVLVVLTGVVFVIAVTVCGLALTRTLRSRRR